MPDDKTPAQIREDAIRLKITAGLTCEQAIDVVDRQAEADEAAKPKGKGK